MGGIADEAHPCACLSRIAIATAAKVREEGLRGAITGAESRRPDDIVDLYRVWVLALFAGQRARTVLLDQFLAVLHRRL